MKLESTLSIHELTYLFSEPTFSVEHLKTLFSFNISSLNYPLLPNILLENNKNECLKEYLENIKDKSYLIIHFFTDKTNLPEDIMNFARPYIDNLCAIYIDKLNFNDFFALNEQFPGNIKGQTILQLIKIYENNQQQYFYLPLFEQVENTILQAFDQFNDKDYIFHKDLNHTAILPLYIKIAQFSSEENSLNFLDQHFKKYLPSHFANYIDNLKLSRSLDSKLISKNTKKIKNKI